ncbi:cell division protein FtsQ/DivIB [Amphiplicatus metriothermophilus]|uniref:Cell division protein FtsQ n=1 Tax=Amphiplicatus metriothermophilus TaxID=1519374 RepID=A0A239PUG4_9PROT|nr:cell division protein FtsQ/DivIB [Amphiplicatus metriothermophilus]MBB5519258.1 cell division protein FtsQ [Amphiplicatus metriothermophilus]SNT73327.1 cell division protein FtsQ [Amphiplicatus metriothermophilus]
MNKPKRKAKTKKQPARRRTAKAKPPSLWSRLAGASRNYLLAGAAGACVILVGAGIMLWSGGYVGLLGERIDRALRESATAAGFEIRRVTLKGRRETANDELEAALGPALGKSILHFDIEAARARIEELGWVRAAAVSRLLPDTVHVSIRERAPAAVWQLSGRLYLIDDRGVVIRPVSGGAYPHLPFIVGAGAPEAAAGVLQALAGHEALRAQTLALVRVSERRWDVKLRNETVVMLPEENFARALDEVAALHAANGLLDQPLEYVDLRDPERLVVRRRGEE